MKSPGLAMLWETFARQRWLSVTIVFDLAIIAILVRVLPREWLEIDTVKFFGSQLILWFFLSLIALFSLSMNQPQTGREGYPSRMYLYPITTFRLVAWPMLFGVLAMIVGWFAIVFVVLRPIGGHPPLLLGSLGVAAAMTWVQAMSWWPFRSTLTRIFMISLVAIGLTTLVVWPMMVWESGTIFGSVLLSTYIAAAFGMALKGVALDRRGARHGDRNRSPLRERVDRLVEAITPQKKDFRSAAQAQFWFEWRTKGAFLVILIVGFVGSMAILLAVVPIYEHKKPDQVRMFFGLAIVIPAYLSWIVGTAFGKDEVTSKNITLSPFIATRPLMSGVMAELKLRAAAVSLLVASGFVLMMFPFWFVMSGNVETLAVMLRPIIAAKGVETMLLVAILCLIAVLTLTWKGMIGAMLPNLTGRPWVGQYLTLLFIPTVIILILFAVYGTRDHDRLMLWVSRSLIVLPWVLGIQLGLKLIISAIAFREALRRKLISTKMLIASAALWAVISASVFGPVAILLPPASISLWITLALAAALIPPFGRMALAPLALDWNRHQ